MAAALTLARKTPNALMLVAPSDHVIKGDVTRAVKAARSAAQSGHIVVFGIPPRYAETGFGYILDQGAVAGMEGVRHCGGLVEKPSHFKASQLIASNAAFWASGISLFTADTLIAEFARFAPETLKAMKAAVCGARENLLSRPSYAQASIGSTEQMIFERSARMLRAPLDVEWDDVGCWTSMHAIGNQDAKPSKIMVIEEFQTTGLKPLVAPRLQPDTIPYSKFRRQRRPELNSPILAQRIALNQPKQTRCLTRQNIHPSLSEPAPLTARQSGQTHHTIVLNRQHLSLDLIPRGRRIKPTGPIPEHRRTGPLINPPARLVQRLRQPAYFRVKGPSSPAHLTN